MRTDAASRRHQALELLAEGQPPQAVAERLGVSLRSIRRYLSDPAARATLQRLRDERLAQLAGRALAEATPALAILRQIAENPDAPPQARVSAASKLLDLAVRLAEAVDLAERVRQLEDQVEQGGGRHGAP